MLNEEERSLVRKAFGQGPSALHEAGYVDPKAMEAFLSRPDVKGEMELLQAEFNNQEALQTRTRFVAKRQLSRLAPHAVALLAQAMAGPIYARDAQGNVMLDVVGRKIIQHPEVTPIQLHAAESVLDCLGVSEKATTINKGADVNVNLLFKRGQEIKITVEPGKELKSEEERALSRERVRNVIEVLSRKLPSLKQKAEERLSGKAKKKRKPIPVSAISPVTA